MEHLKFKIAITYSALLLFILLFAPLIQAQGGKQDPELEKGLKLYEAAKYDEAATVFKRLAEKDPTNVEAFYNLGNAYFIMVHYRDAVKAYKRVVALSPDHFLAMNNLGTAYHSLGDFKQAVASYEAALRVKPDYSQAMLGLGVAYLELKNKEAALKQHEKLSLIDQDRADKLFSYISNKKIDLPILNGKALHLVKPDYPPAARAAHASGPVIVWISIDETGKVVSASVVQGNVLLRSVALQAAKLSEFSPTKLKGEPVRVTGFIQYNFVPE